MMKQEHVGDVYQQTFITMTSCRSPWRLKSPASRLFTQAFIQWKKTPKLRVTGLYEGNSPVTGELPAQRASSAENVFIWWRHHVDRQHQSLLCHAWHKLWTSTQFFFSNYAKPSNIVMETDYIDLQCILVVDWIGDGCFLLYECVQSMFSHHV